MPQRWLQPLRLLAAGAFACLLSGCMAMAVGSAAVSITASAVGLAADAAVGSAKLVGKGVKAGMEALSDDEDTTEHDVTADHAVDRLSESHLIHSD